MELIHLANGHGFEALGAIAIVASLLFTAVELRHSVRAQRVANLNALTKNHREIWTEILKDPDLGRILATEADISRNPVTIKEKCHVNFLLLQLYASFKSSKAGMFVQTESLPQEIAHFLSLPIPHQVWQSLIANQDKDFVTFVANALENNPASLRPHDQSM